MKARTTKRSLALSMLALLVCISMFVGSTFAWFTDSVSSVNNIIKSGNLDVVLEYKTDWADAWTPVTESTKIFNKDALYEPGYTETVFLRVSNAGTLALKYSLGVNIASETEGTNVYDKNFKLSDYLQVGAYIQNEYNDGANFADILMPAMFGSRDAAISSVQNSGTKFSKLQNITFTADNAVLPGDETAQVIALVLNMPETVDNSANYKTGTTAPEINLGVILNATQLTSEEDSFGSDYDEDAEFDTVVTSAAELKEALAAGESVTLADDLDLTDEPLVIAAGDDVVIDLGGNTIEGVSTASKTSYLFDVKAGSSLTLKNGTVTFEATDPDTEWGGAGQKPFPGYANNTIKCSGDLIIDGATIINDSGAGGATYAIDCYQGANLIVNSGTITSTNNVAIRMFANSDDLTTAVTINGGTITGKRAIWVHLPRSNPANEAPVELTINGGTLSSNNGSEALYSYSYGESFESTNITITGGTFNGNVYFGGGAKDTQENVTITGGTFNGELGRWLAGDVFEAITF